MKRNGDGSVWGLAFEFAPAVIFGSAVAFAISTALSLQRFDVITLSAGVGAFALSWLLLRRLGSGRDSLPLADFNQSDLERELATLAEEMQRSDFVEDELLLEYDLAAPFEDELILEDEFASHSADELLLDDPVTGAPEDSRVIRLFDPRTETAGEMQARIDRHLRNTPRPPLSDATQELHEALAALRSSLR